MKKIIAISITCLILSTSLFAQSKKISDLPAVTTPAPTDVLPIVNANKTKKITVSDLLSQTEAYTSAEIIGNFLYLIGKDTTTIELPSGGASEWEIVNGKLQPKTERPFIQTFNGGGFVNDTILGMFPFVGIKGEKLGRFESLAGNVKAGPNDVFIIGRVDLSTNQGTFISLVDSSIMDLRSNNMYLNAQNDMGLNAQNNMYLNAQNEMNLSSQNKMSIDSENEMSLNSENDMGLSSQDSMSINSQNHMFLSSQNNMSLTSQNAMSINSQDAMFLNSENAMSLTSENAMSLTSQNDSLTFIQIANRDTLGSQQTNIELRDSTAINFMTDNFKINAQLNTNGFVIPNLETEPSGKLGAIYYNTTLNAFRKYGNLGWENF